MVFDECVVWGTEQKFLSFYIDDDFIWFFMIFSWFLWVCRTADIDYYHLISMIILMSVWYGGLNRNLYQFILMMILWVCATGDWTQIIIIWMIFDECAVGGTTQKSLLFNSIVLQEIILIIFMIVIILMIFDDVLMIFDECAEGKMTYLSSCHPPPPQRCTHQRNVVCKIKWTK